MGVSVSPFQAPQYSNVIELGVKPPGLAASSLISGSVGRQFSVRVEQPAAEWVAAALERIEELTALARGWDGYDAKPIDATVAVQAVRFVLDHAYPSVPQPAIVPSADGGIQIEWHRGGIDLEVSISDHESTVYVEDHETGTSEERPAAEATVIFSNLFGRLARA
jgi:hypothetical protein